MLRNLQDLHGYAIRATDGVIGHVKDTYFDDHNWAVRYVVVDTGSWLSSRKVLISLFSIGKPDWAERVLPVSITQEQVRGSPDIDTDKPVSRQHEMQYLDYYRLPYYWGGTGLWAGAAYPGAMLTGIGYEGSGGDYLLAQANNARTAAAAEERRQDENDPYLRSCNALLNYQIEASDGEMGRVKGMLVDEATWAVRYMVVETGSWWLGHQVLIAPQWIREVRWSDETVAVGLTRQAVKEAPAYDSSSSLSREHETDLYRHHGRAGYWAREIGLQNPEFHGVKSSAPGSIHKNA
jgi:PRC-barrel domain protein